MSARADADYMRIGASGPQFVPMSRWTLSVSVKRKREERDRDPVPFIPVDAFQHVLDFLPWESLSALRRVDRCGRPSAGGLAPSYG
jgi:hypothetical protein